MTEQQRVRRNIHTYPFKYEHLDSAEFFALDKAVIYVHIPFCTRKCHFCDYVVNTNSTLDARSAYVEALCREIAAFPDNRAFPGFRIDAIYVGGGTPGLLEAEQLVRILDTCRAAFDLVDDCELGVEFDPASVRYDKLVALRDAGYTRISMGVQSFDEQVLKANNRPHVLADCFTAWDAIQRAGFTHSNIDLIYPLVGQDMELWERSVQQAIDLEPGCITAYSLEVWPNTAYHHWLSTRKHELPSAEDEVEMCRRSLDRLEAAGYVRGSSSGYFHPARCARYCRYLDYYWRTWPMIGFGVSSKSVIRDRLYTNIRSTREYIRRTLAGEPVMDFATQITKPQEMRRVMIRGLKMCEVSKHDFYGRFGVPMEAIFGAEIDDLVGRGFLISDPDRVYLTREGQVYSTNVYERFYTEEDLRPPLPNEVQFGISELVTT